MQIYLTGWPSCYKKTSPLQQENEWGSSIISLFIVETGVPKGTKLKLQLESFDQFF